jgi:hypothetical protein
VLLAERVHRGFEGRWSGGKEEVEVVKGEIGGSLGVWIGRCVSHGGWISVMTMLHGGK